MTSSTNNHSNKEDTKEIMIIIDADSFGCFLKTGTTDTALKADKTPTETTTATIKSISSSEYAYPSQLIPV